MGNQSDTPRRNVRHQGDEIVRSPDTDGDEPATLASELTVARESGTGSGAGDEAIARSSDYDGEPEPVHSRLRREES